MTRREHRLYSEASLLARDAMGKKKIGAGRGAYTVVAAEQDPLEWWCLTECIVAIAKRYAN